MVVVDVVVVDCPVCELQPPFGFTTPSAVLPTSASSVLVVERLLTVLHDSSRP